MSSCYRETIPWLLLAALVIFAIDLAQGATITVHSGDCIQAAIDASMPGDVIDIKKGSYSEDILIHKPLTLRGSGRLELSNSAQNTIKGNDVHDNGSGILLYYSGSCIIEDNHANNNNGFNIHFVNSGRNKVEGNTGKVDHDYVN